MHRRIANALVVALIAGAALSAETALAPRPASAYHTYQSRLLDTTAYSLNRRGFRIGLFKLSYGAFDFFQISTYTAPWLLGLVFEQVAPNVELKSTFYDGRRLALSTSAGFVTGAVEQVVGVEASRLDYYIVPVSMAASVRIDSRLKTHVGGMYTAVQGDANAGLGTSDVEGSALVDLLQLWAMVEWRFTRIVAFTFTARWVPWVSDTIVRGRLEGEDGNLGIDVQVELDFIDLRHAFAIIPGFVFSWERANVRLGVGYGDFFVEGFALVVPRDVLGGVSPELDVFVRF